MAGRQPPPPRELLQREPGSSRSEASFLDRFLWRPLETSDQDLGCAAATSESLPSPALVPNCDDVPADPGGNYPWQYLSTSGPSSPTSQRDGYSHLMQSPLFPSSHYQRDLGMEYPWMQEVLEQQLLDTSSQAHNQSMDSRSGALENVDWQRCLRESMGHHHRALLAPGRGHLIPRRRREPLAHPSDTSAAPNHRPSNPTDAILFQEAAAAAWFRNNGYLIPDFACGEGRNENFSWLGSSESQSSDSAAVLQGLHGRDVDELARMRWERLAMTSQFMETAATHRDLARESDAGAFPPPRRAPSPASAVADAGALGGSTQSANSPDVDTSPSSESGDDGSDDEEEGTRSIDPSGSGGGDGDGGAKRKILEVSEEEGDDVAARMASKVEPKHTSSSGPRKRAATTKMKQREPRYAIKTRTDVDIMDDGFKWRKYGQKAVKNSPHPRNYYRCTTPNCPVRKRVERSHEDAGLVITTYEGKHMHATPGFHRPGAPNVERPRPGSGLFNHTPLGSAGLGPLGGLLPIPPEFSLAALHQLRALRSLHALAQQIGRPPGSRLLPGSLERDSLLRARHFLGMHDAAFGTGSAAPVKHHERREFTTPASRPGSQSVPYPPGGHYSPPPGSSYLDLMHAMRPHPPPAPAPVPARHLRAVQPDLDSFSDLSADSDLVRRVLAAEEQELSGDGGGPTSTVDHDLANVDSASFNYGGTPDAPSPPTSPTQSHNALHKCELFNP